MQKLLVFRIDVSSDLYDCSIQYQERKLSYGYVNLAEQMKYIFDKNDEDMKRIQRKS